MRNVGRSQRNLRRRSRARGSIRAAAVSHRPHDSVRLPTNVARNSHINLLNFEIRSLIFRGFQDVIQATRWGITCEMWESLSVRLFLSRPITRVGHLGTTTDPGLVPTDDHFTNSARVHYHGGMTRFRRDDAPSLVRAARQDASLTQAELAAMTGMSQSTLAQIESGRRAVSAELLERILRVADYRPSVPLARYAPSISSYAQERGLGSLRVFGSVARGTDGFESDIDLIGTPTRELSLFELADIASFACELTGFPTEVHADTHVPEALRTAVDEAVAL